MGKIIHKIIPQHLRIAQLFRHLVKAVGQLRKSRIACKNPSELKPCLKIPGSQTVDLVDQIIDRL